MCTAERTCRRKWSPAISCSWNVVATDYGKVDPRALLAGRTASPLKPTALSLDSGHLEGSPSKSLDFIEAARLIVDLNRNLADQVPMLCPNPPKTSPRFLPSSSIGRSAPLASCSSSTKAATAGKGKKKLSTLDRGEKKILL